MNLQDIERNLSSLNAADIEKLSQLAFDAGHEGNDYAKGVDHCLAYLAGFYEVENLLDYIE